MRRSITVCDFCGRTKQESNHWFEISASGYFAVRQHHPEIDGSEIFSQDACGVRCALIAFQQWVSKIQPSAAGNIDANAVWTQAEGLEVGKES